MVFRDDLLLLIVSTVQSIDLCPVRQSLSLLRLAPNRPCMSLVKDEVGMVVPKNIYTRFVGITYHVIYIPMLTFQVSVISCIC